MELREISFIGYRMYYFREMLRNGNKVVFFIVNVEMVRIVI